MTHIITSEVSGCCDSIDEFDAYIQSLKNRNARILSYSINADNYSMVYGTDKISFSVLVEPRVSFTKEQIENYNGEKEKCEEFLSFGKTCTCPQEN